MSADPAARAERLSAVLDAERGAAQRIAKKLGVNPSAVSRWRTGKDPLSWERAQEIAPLVGLTASYLYAGVEGWRPGLPLPRAPDELAEIRAELARHRAALERAGLIDSAASTAEAVAEELKRTRRKP